MEILRTIKLLTLEKGMPFIVIGGHAINFYGLSRQTGDIDFIVPLVDKDKWIDLFGKLRYEHFQNDNRFTRFSPISLNNWPIDLMYVNCDTFTKLLEASVKGEIADIEIEFISIEHLVTLKLHALKSNQIERYGKDYSDLLWLINSGKMAIELDELRKLCDKYGPKDFFVRLSADIAPRKS